MRNDRQRLPGANGEGSRVSFPGVSFRTYEHPAALTALIAMKRARGFDLLLKKVHGAVGEPVVRMQHLTSAVRVGPRQFPRLHGLKEEAAGVLDLPETPELYVRSMGEVNAFAVGMDRPFLVLSSELVDVMNEDEIRFVLGHELGHVLSGHVLYQTVARIIASIGLASFPVAGLALEAVDAALKDWTRKSELSCDRAGLLVAQDLDVAVRALMKLVVGARAEEMNPAEFLQQAAEFELDATGWRNRVYKHLMPSGSHPILVLRASELDRWVRHGDYERILRSGEYEMRSEDGQATFRGGLRDHIREMKDKRDQKAADRALRGYAPPAQRGNDD
ncbi:M48 family metallopeptidase [Streptomyces phaeofaciens JCM 4814]|uniref:Zn-dependent protease n=1 Tax=Streptomyces phaeofaciens TaxID=68254 RepID=A0A918LPD5_9ACTN|nr:Zn-dependent protease [Streptomyces phaeofaciens]